MVRNRKPNRFKRGKEWNAGSSELHEQAYRKRRSGKNHGWFGQSYRHSKAARLGWKRRKRKPCKLCR